MNRKNNKMDNIKAGIQLASIVTICGTTIFLGNKVINSNNVKAPVEYRYTDISELSKQQDVEYLKTNEVVENLQQVNNIEVLQINASTSYDVSLGNYKLTKKTKNIKFYGLGSYKIDLSTLRSDQVVVNGKGKTVTLLLEKNNIIIDCDILSEKTTYMDIYEGCLAWYNFELSPEEAFNLESQAKNSLLENKLSFEDNKSAIISKCEMNLQSILDSFTDESYRVTVKFIEE